MRIFKKGDHSKTSIENGKKKKNKTPKKKKRKKKKTKKKKRKTQKKKRKNPPPRDLYLLPSGKDTYANSSNFYEKT